jgi:hypothetical protein
MRLDVCVSAVDGLPTEREHTLKKTAWWLETRASASRPVSSRVACAVQERNRQVAFLTRGRQRGREEVSVMIERGMHGTDCLDSQEKPQLHRLGPET